MKRSLSGGDAVAVVALLLFIVGWVAGWSWSVELAQDDGTLPADLGDATLWEQVVLLWLVGWPTLWAGRLVGFIIRGAWVQR